MAATPANRPRQRRLWLAGGILGVIGLLVQMPAALLEPLCRGAYRCADTQGTVWHGGLSLFWREAAGGNSERWAPVAILRWHWQPTELLSGGLIWRCESADGGRFEAGIGLGGWQWQSDRLRLPAAAMAVSLPPPLPRDGWGGEIEIASSGWQCGWNGNACAGSLTLDWRKARANTVSAAPLGDYRIVVQASAGRPIALRSTTLRGSLHVEGGGELGAGGSAGTAGFKGEAWAEGSERERIETFLHPLGRYDVTSGRYQIVLKETRLAAGLEGLP